MPPTDANVQRLEYRGAPQTVAVLKRAILESANHLNVRQCAEQICQGLDSKDYLSEYLAFYYTGLQRCRYMRDPKTVELVRAPWVICDELLAGRTPCLDCDDFSGLIGSWVLAVGGRVRLATVAFNNAFYQGRRQYSHVFAQAQIPQSGIWVTLDPVAAEKTAEMQGRVVATAVWDV